MTECKQQSYINDNTLSTIIFIIILILYVNKFYVNTYLYILLIIVTATLISYLYFTLTSIYLTRKYNKIHDKYDSDTKGMLNKINKNLNSSENKALALFGSWGSGKTYLWENTIKPSILPSFWVIFKTIIATLIQISFVLSLAFILIHNNDNNDNNVFKAIAIFLINHNWLIYLSICLTICIRIESVINGQVIYVSLFGKESFKQTLDEIAQKSQSNKDFASKIITGLINRITGEKDLFSNLSEDDLKGKLVCIDDIERRPKTMRLEDVLGLISHLKTINKCNVIAIIGLQNKKDSTLDYTETIKQKMVYTGNINWEKTINEHYGLQGDRNSMLKMVEETINSSKYKNYKIHKKALQNAIYNINQGSYYNLRKYKEIIERLIKEDDVDKIFRKELNKEYCLWFLTECFQHYIHNDTLCINYDYLCKNIIIKNIHGNITYEKLVEIYKVSYDLVELFENDKQKFYRQYTINKDCMFWLIVANISYGDNTINLIYNEVIKTIGEDKDKKIKEFLQDTEKIKKLFDENQQELHEAIKIFNDNIAKLGEKNDYPNIYKTIENLKYTKEYDNKKIDEVKLNKDVLMTLALKLLKCKYQDDINEYNLLKALLDKLDSDFKSA